MAGFLTHIATRLEGTEEMLRPKTPALFEPEPSGGRDAAAVLSTGESAFTDAPAGFEEAHRQSIANTRASRRYDPDARAPIATEHSILVYNGDPNEHTPQANQPRIKALASDRQAGLPRGAVVDASAEKDATPPRGKSKALRPARIAGEGSMIRPPQLRPVEPTEAAALARDTHDAAEPVRLLRAAAPDGAILNNGAVISEKTRAPALNAPGILQAPIAARLSPAPPLPTPRAQESEPTIHVTIGRVEVRAIAAESSQPKRAEQPSPVMSLDEYLRTRAR
jgi:hypothetical protein